MIDTPDPYGLGLDAAESRLMDYNPLWPRAFAEEAAQISAKCSSPGRRRWVAQPSPTTFFSRWSSARSSTDTGWACSIGSPRPLPLPSGSAVYAAQVLLSTLWLRRFQFGPMEWLWRALMYGRPPELRRLPTL